MAASVKIDKEWKGRIQHLAGVRRRSAHGIMRKAIRQYVEREEACESSGKEAMASGTDYRETGRHLTGRESRA